MAQPKSNGRVPPSTSAGRPGAGDPSRSAPPSLKPNYSSRAVYEALQHLASVDLIELCSEAKVERCRATRDLRSCGRYVQYVLESCGHASLCYECSQRCDVCPICRVPLPKNGDRLHLRLYYECIEAGLISKRFDERFQEDIDGDENQLTADVQHLYSLFDVAMENNLVSLICHYVTDVCMDESAISSDPVTAFLLDEVVVKDWCNRTFKYIIVELQEIYNLEAEKMKTRLDSLMKISLHLAGISNVLEVLESSFKDSLSAQLHDLQVLQEATLKTKQHTEIMIWCIRHHFLENVKPRYADPTSWRNAICERKSAAVARSWPNMVNQSSESGGQVGSLFIEDAMANLDTEHGQTQEVELLLPLWKDRKCFLSSNLGGLSGCYPFECTRTATDVLFLCGSSDMAVAKKAIFIYYLFDRHWTMPDKTWRHFIDDFAAAFDISRHSLLESLTFYLLDDCTNESLQVVCDLLPEISGPSTHPKVAQVLLERGVPETALMVLRWSGRDGSDMVSLTEAVTTVQVRVQCGLLTEAFMHQRMLCTRVREKKLFGDLKGECQSWEHWVEILVTEICCLCIKSNLVVRMIEFPWNRDEEKYLHKCLLDCAYHDPSTTTGSLLVVFYLQRYRYAEAYQVHLKLQCLEKDFIPKNSVSSDILSRMNSASHWRAELVEESMKLLPEVQQQLIKNGNFSSNIIASGEEVTVPAVSDHPIDHETQSSILLFPPSAESSVNLQENQMTTSKPLFHETPIRLNGYINFPQFEVDVFSTSSILDERLFKGSLKPQHESSIKVEGSLKPETNINKSLKYHGISRPIINDVSPISSMPLNDISRARRGLSNGAMNLNQVEDVSVRSEQNDFHKQLKSTSPGVAHRLKDDPVSINRIFPYDSQWVSASKMSGKQAHSRQDDVSWNMSSGDDSMDVTWSGREENSPVDGSNQKTGLRWRSDETSDDEAELSPNRAFGSDSRTAGARRKRSSRFITRLH